MSPEPFDPKPILAQLPNLPGVYRMKNAADEVIYVGKARDLKKRVSSYFVKQHPSPRTTLMVSQVVAIETTLTRSESDALLLENNLIKELNPRYNVLFRDDKSYPYIMLTAREYPQIRFARGAHQKPNKYFGPFPSSWAVRDTIKHLQKVFKLRTCDDSVFSHRARPCLLHQIGRCSAPCVSFISPDDYARDVKNAALFLEGKEGEVINDISAKMEAAAEKLEYEAAARFRDQVKTLKHVFSKQFVESASERDCDIIALAERSGIWCVNLAMVRGGRHLGDKPFFPSNARDVDAIALLEAFLEQHYAAYAPPPTIMLDRVVDAELVGDWESALTGMVGKQVHFIAQLKGEARVWMQLAARNALYAIDQRLADKASQQSKLVALNASLGLEGVARIECFDISHTMGEATVASCVVFDQGAMQSSQYRHYNIAGITPGDDYAAMRDVLTRRYRKVADEEENAIRPDLVLIDGGKGQLSVAEEVMNELGLQDIQLLGVAKGEERKPGLETLIFGGTRVELHLPKSDGGLHLIQQIRDEAHRFAITGHRARRGKARKSSKLEDISGIGPKRRKALIQRFGGLQGVQAASIDDLANVEGISVALAEEIYRQMR